ncbi:hypothetical protein IEQ34_015145 [Dendrobium chrysotoxum]|uniref:Uncharacterized protein n=1 Tax=Dendrobium chrysotoxum TaxID=161865 RepID=A0AAV7GNK2_DENCH|nr:hypothetical protein IEQ34_015145 [Dendrobium chrysotoxum]
MHQILSTRQAARTLQDEVTDTGWKYPDRFNINKNTICGLALRCSNIIVPHVGLWSHCVRNFGVAVAN